MEGGCQCHAENRALISDGWAGLPRLSSRAVSRAAGSPGAQQSSLTSIPRLPQDAGEGRERRGTGVSSVWGPVYGDRHVAWT